MRAVIQRVSRAAVSVENAVCGEIGPGLLVFLGVGQEDNPQDVDWLAQKVSVVRVFEDEAGKMNRSIRDVEGGILVISQFTLFGNLRKGTRPSFNRAAPPELAVPLYESFVTRLSELLGKPVPTGVFGAMMRIEAHNDGPVTLILDSKAKDQA